MKQKRGRTCQNDSEMWYDKEKEKRKFPGKAKDMGQKAMYYRNDWAQLTIEELFNRLAADYVRTTVGVLSGNHALGIHRKMYIKIRGYRVKSTSSKILGLATMTTFYPWCLLIYHDNHIKI